MKMNFCAVLCSLWLGSFSFAGERPNVVIIYGDDVGYGDVGAYGSKLIPTPNIDRLAKEGLRFTDGHCTAATCTPSRYALLTGIHGFRENINIGSPTAPLSIATDILTLPKLFQQAGYTTGIVGKWHLGLGEKDGAQDWNGEVKPGPLEVGFDSSFLLPVTNDRVPCVYLRGHRVVNLDPNDPIFIANGQPLEVEGSTSYPNGQVTPEAMTYYKNTHGHNCSVINGIGRMSFMVGGKSALWDDETMSDEFVKEAKTFIADNKKTPFFLYFSSQDIHVPRAPHPRFQGKTTLGYRGDAMVQFDWSTGEILDALEEHGLTDNTIVIFSSDNGPTFDDGYDDGTTVKTSNKEVDGGHDASGIYSGGKYSIKEGGTRVPFIVRWPGKIEPGVSEALVSQVDLLASFAQLFDIELADGVARDSRNTLEAFLGNDAVGLPFLVEEAGPVKRALRRGDWKFVAETPPFRSNKAQPARLYNLSNDPGERENLIKDHPEVADSMERQLQLLIAGGGIRTN